MSPARAVYRAGLVVSFALLLREIGAEARLEGYHRGVDAMTEAIKDQDSDLEPVDCTDVLAAHGVQVS